MIRIHVALIVAVASTVTIGCSAHHDAPTAGVTPATTAKSAFQLLIAGTRPIPDSCQAPGETLAPGPTVLVTDSSGAPVGGVLVSFQVLSGNGSIEHGLATTDANGLASGGGWTLGSGFGVNFVRALLVNGDSLEAVYFSVSTASSAKVVAVFQLQQIGGRPLPQSFGGPAVTGGHYYLAANGTYAFGYEYNPIAAPATICSSARYVVGSSAIDFYLAPGSYPLSTFYQQGDGGFATGTLSGSSMSVKYVDLVDFEDEAYALASGAVPSLTVNK